MGALFAAFGTVAVICEGELTVKVALLPPNITVVAPVKLDPFIVTDVPTGPFGGVKPLIVGADTRVKFAPLVAFPPGVVTEIGPLLAPIGTVAMIFMPLNLKLAVVTLKLTCVAPFRFAPEIVTEMPTGPLAGEKPLMVGGALETTVNVDALVPVPPGVVTEIGPLVAPEGTVAVICVSRLTVKVALVPLNFTDVAPLNALPVMVTVTPVPPLVGVNPLIAGGGMTVKFAELVPVPPGVVTPITPVLAPDGTVAVI